LAGLFCSFYTTSNITPGITTSWTFSVNVSCGTGLSNPTGGVANDSYFHAGSPLTPNVFNKNLNGSFTISADVEEWLDEYACHYIDADPLSPTYGYPQYPETEGNTVIDPPLGTHHSPHVRLKVGGTLSISVTIGTVTASASLVIVNNAVVTERIDAVSSGLGAGAYTSFGTNGVYWGNTAIETPFTYSANGATIDAFSGAMVNTGGKNASINASIYPDLTYNLSGVFKCFTGNHPGVVGFYFDRKLGKLKEANDSDASGNFSLSDIQHKYVCSGNCNGSNSPNVTVDERAPLRIYLRQDWIAEKKTDPNDWRVLFRGFSYPSLTIAKAPTQTVDDCTSLTGWAAGANTTLSIFGGFIRAVIGGGVGDFTRTFADDTPSFTGKSFESGRWMTVNITADAACTVTMTINSKTWTLNVGTTGSVLVDTCSPTGYTTIALPDVDETDTAVPLDASVEGAYWGINHCATMKFSAIPNGRTITLSGITINKVTRSEMWITPEYNNFLKLHADGVTGAITTETFQRRLITGDVDFRTSLEYRDFTKVVNTSSTTGQITITYTEDTLAQINTAINATNYPAKGWSCTQAGSFVDGYRTNSRPACWLFGNGLFYDGSVWQEQPQGYPSWVIKAQALFDSISLYADMGDYCAWTDSTFGPVVELRSGMQLRGDAWGIVVDGTGGVNPGTTVAMTRVFLPEAAGDGISDAQGGYETGPAYGRGNVSHKIECQSQAVPLPKSTQTLKARKRHKVSFKAPGDSSFASLTGGALECVPVKSYLHVGNIRRIRTMNDGDFTIVSESDNLEPDKFVGFSWDSFRAKLYCVGVVGTTDFRVYYSTDNGLTVVGVLSLTAKSIVITKLSESGGVIVLYQDVADDTIRQRRSKDGGTTWDAAIVCKLSGVTMKASFLAGITYDPFRNTVFLSMIDTGGSIITRVVYSTNMGLDWETALV
jgi:hypothetical protein